MDLQGKIAVVTGSASGIGRACAVEFASRGCDVVVADIHEERLKETAALVESQGRRALVVLCDVGSDEQVDALRRRTTAEFGRADLVMSNVGILAMGLPHTLPMEQWQRVIDVNLLGTVRMLNTFVPEMVERGSGHFVTTASTAGLFPYSFTRLPYAASKYAVVGISEGLALYLGPQNIGVSCLCPAAVPSNIAEQITVLGEVPRMQSPPLRTVEADEVGRLVADAVQQNRFLVLTDPAALDHMRARAADPDAFLASQVAFLQQRVDPRR